MRKSIVAAAAAALLLAACGEAEPRSAGAVARTVLTDARTGGTAGFWFLPPIAPEPDDATPNHLGLAPVVRVRELPPGARGEVAVFEVVREAGAHYQVEWPASETPLLAGLTYRIVVELQGATLGYADATVAADASELRFLYSQEVFPLTGERTLPIKFRVAEPAPDADGDLVPDAGDVCPAVADPGQADADEDGVGDACECLGVICAAVDDCHEAGVCDSATGDCSSPVAADGAPCALMSGPGICAAGLCVEPPPAAVGCGGVPPTCWTCPRCGITVCGCADCGTGSCGCPESGGGMMGPGGGPGGR